MLLLENVVLNLKKAALSSSNKRRPNPINCCQFQFLPSQEWLWGPSCPLKEGQHPDPPEPTPLRGSPKLCKEVIWEPQGLRKPGVCQAFTLVHGSGETQEWASVFPVLNHSHLSNQTGRLLLKCLKALYRYFLKYTIICGINIPFY